MNTFRLNFKTIDGEHHHMIVKGDSGTDLLMKCVELDLLAIKKDNCFEYFLLTKHVVKMWFDLIK